MPLRRQVFMGGEKGRCRPSWALLVVLLALLLSAAAVTPRSAVQQARTVGVVRPSSASGLNFDYLVIILMENHAICQILTSCGGSATYMTSLANAHGLATHYVDCNAPSLPNYLCLGGASDFGCGGYDGYPHSNTCTNLAWGSKNIVDRLVNGSLTWKAYMEAMPSNCYGSNSGRYFARHDPFVYFSDIVNNATRCARVIPAGTGDSALLNDLGSTATASNYMWLTPDGCNDMHDCSVATGHNYLKNLVPQILNSTLFKTTRAALFITFDEDSGGSGHPNLYTVWAGPVAKTAYTSSAAYNHFSLLATIESNWNLPALTSHDQGAANMNEFFTGSPGHPTARFTTSPTWPLPTTNVAFDGSTSSDPDPNSTLQFRWDWTNDGTWDTTWSTVATASHVYGTKGTYTAKREVMDSGGRTDNATASIVVNGTLPTTTASRSGTSGSNGWYRSSVKVTLTATDSLSGVAKTFYRVDGGSWNVYSSPVTVSGQSSHSFDDNSTDRAGNVEAMHTSQFKIDTVAPSTTASLQGTKGNSTWYIGPVNVTLAATDATSGVASTKYRVDLGPWTTYTGPVTVSGNGTHQFDDNSTDNAGNAEATKTTLIAIGGPPQGPVSTITVGGTA